MLESSSKLKGVIFDLDGVLVDTAKYHFLAWGKIASQLGYELTLERNEELKGVSRRGSLEILLKYSVKDKLMTENDKEVLLDEKNNIYLNYIKNLTERDLLQGSLPLLRELEAANIKMAIGSASKNANLILSLLGIKKFFNVVISGEEAKRSKPDPEVFLKGLEGLDLGASEVVIIEDSSAGIEAANQLGVKSVGIGDRKNLREASRIVSSLEEVSVEFLNKLLIV